MLIDLFVERQFDPPLTQSDVYAMSVRNRGCFGRYKVDWAESFLALDGRRMLCHFCAPDTESLRLAFRTADGLVPTVWSGTIHSVAYPPRANVIVERRFDCPVELRDIQAIEDTRIGCLETHSVKFVCTYFSLTQTRMICLYQAPDAESVRLAQQQAGMPLERAWSFEYISPSTN